MRWCFSNFEHLNQRARTFNFVNQNSFQPETSCQVDFNPGGDAEEGGDKIQGEGGQPVNSFLATLVALHPTPVSKWVSEWVIHSFGLE